MCFAKPGNTELPLPPYKEVDFTSYLHMRCASRSVTKLLPMAQLLLYHSFAIQLLLASNMRGLYSLHANPTPPPP